MFGRLLIAVLVVAVAGCAAGDAPAQEDLTRGKTPAQLYASDCADCHRNPRALGRRDSAYSLAGFLRVHYTASRESAAALAAYLVALGPEPRGSRPSGQTRQRPAASQGQGRSGPAQPAPAAKPDEAPAPRPPEAVPQTPAAAPTAPAAPPASEPAAPAASPPAAPQ